MTLLHLRHYTLAHMPSLTSNYKPGYMAKNLKTLDKMFCYQVILEFNFAETLLEQIITLC